MKRLSVLLFFLMLGGLYARDWQAFTVKNAALDFLPEELNDAGTTTTIKAKNPKLAFAMSAIIPGSGQVYSRSYLKAVAFVGIEVAAWALHFQYNNKGQRIEDEYHAFASAHWSENEYWKWIAHQAGLEYNPNNLEPLREWEHASFSHGLHREKDQQYYEMIGKYHQFSWGWDDFRENHNISITDQEITARYNEDKDSINENRLEYETKRNDMNSAYKKATTATTFVIVNHLLSAADAAWTTTKYNRDIQVGLRVEPMQLGYETETVLTLRANW